MWWYILIVVIVQFTSAPIKIHGNETGIGLADFLFGLIGFALLIINRS